MFYFREIFIRLKYYFLSFICTILITYFYKSVLFILLTLPLISHFMSQSQGTLNSFIYTHPAELLTIHFLLMFLVSFSFQIPYFFWHCVDFIKTSLSKEEHENLTFTIIFFNLLFLLFNFLCFFIVFPKLWLFFQSFNFSFNEPQTLNFFLELRVQEYFSFVLEFIYTINILIFFLYLLFFLILLFGIENLLYWKKLFIFINIVFATLLSPPDVYSQLAILFVLTFVLEAVIFINLYFIKIHNLFISTASY